ncbi:glycosyltransferase [Synechococcus sp. SYN20]|uniref:glycosyltransferase n=1 Tax=Synechococcus sp. SYN20 TaxID=1050714 RepID=UPI001CA3CA5C|nr:glycosyltransferase [Synechococcus sp. SYN20]
MFRVGSGGVEQRRLLIARKLDPDRYEQKLICTDAWGGLPERFVDAGCEVIHIGQIRHIADVRVYRNALRCIKQWQPDIIHGAVYEGVAIAAVAGRLSRVPVVIGEETSDPQNRRWSGHLLFRLLSGLTHHMVAVSPAVQEYLRDTLRLPSDKVSLINNGVDEHSPSDAQEDQRMLERFNFRSQDFVIGTVGRLVDEHKRVSDLIRTLALLHAAGMRSTRLLLVGDGPDRKMLENFAVSLGVRESVHFAGYIANPQPLYAVMDVFALASAAEAFGLVLVEAMFAGLPVIATRVGGIPGVVEDGRTGVLVPAFSPERFAEELLRLAMDETVRREMGARGQQRAQTLFSADRYVADVDCLYQRLSARVGLP